MKPFLSYVTPVWDIFQVSGASKEKRQMPSETHLFQSHRPLRHVLKLQAAFQVTVDTDTEYDEASALYVYLWQRPH